MAPPMAILLLDDDPDVGVAARMLLQREFGPVRLLQHSDQLARVVDTAPIELLLLDMNFLPGHIDSA